MKRRSGFTLIEIVIVMVMISAISGSFLMLASRGYEWFTSLAMQNSCKAETQTAAERVFRLAAANHRYTIDADNHGLSFPDGTRVRWEGQRLELRSKNAPPSSLLTSPVVDFTAVQNGGILTVNLAVETPTRPQGQPLRVQEIYDYPRVGP